MPSTIAERITALRTERNWSKSELGRRIGARNAHYTVQRYETGDVVPGPRVLERFAKAFGVPITEIDPSGSASKGSGRRPKSHSVDNPVEVGKIPDSHQLPTMTEGLMREQVERLKGALSLVPQERRDHFIRRVSVLAAQLLLETEEPGAMPGKRKRASGEH